MFYYLVTHFPNKVCFQYSVHGKHANVSNVMIESKLKVCNGSSWWSGTKEGTRIHYVLTVSITI